ncbi:N-acetylglucosamine kinase [Brachybacterium paraconglomeratum]|uniref:N-acetylglucosamine kinase n=1 Tax=Brachybacterium paraconglomeratum TaxID=173362 RepID=UPI0037C52324
MDQARAQGEFVIGIYGGGTHTRVACVGLDGKRLSIARGGGASPMHNDDAEENVRSTLARALSEAGLDASGAAALVAGMAGFERTSSPQGLRQNAAVERSVELDGLTCPRTVVNDAVIAHRGALSGRAGVVVVAGTGSMILAIDEQGTDLESGQYGHYAGAARHLAHDVVQRVLLGESSLADPLHTAVLAHFGAEDVDGLRTAALELSTAHHNDAKRSYGALAPQVTELAEQSPLADASLRHLAGLTARGVRLLAPSVAADPVPVACTGSLASDPRFHSRLERALSDGEPRPTELVAPRLDPLGGAVLLALERAGVPADAAVLAALEASPTGAAA